MSFAYYYQVLLYLINHVLCFMYTYIHTLIKWNIFFNIKTIKTGGKNCKNCIYGNEYYEYCYSL